MPTDAEKYGIESGQYWLAADGSKTAKWVIDTKMYADCGDILVMTLLPDVWPTQPDRIDAFKLAKVRYYLCPIENTPDWLRQWFPVTEKRNDT